VVLKEFHGYTGAMGYAVTETNFEGLTITREVFGVRDSVVWKLGSEVVANFGGFVFLG
jgi:hypothetical protein